VAPDSGRAELADATDDQIRFELDGVNQ